MASYIYTWTGSVYYKPEIYNHEQHLGQNLVLLQDQ